MDAMTTSSANRGTGSDSGRSGDANPPSRADRENQGGGWGWFTKVKSSSESGPDAGHERAGDPDGSAIPTRTPTPIRPVGTGAERFRAGQPAPGADAAPPRAPEAFRTPEPTPAPEPFRAPAPDPFRAPAPDPFRAPEPEFGREPAFRRDPGPRVEPPYRLDAEREPARPEWDARPPATGQWSTVSLQTDVRPGGVPAQRIPQRDVTVPGARAGQDGDALVPAAWSGMQSDAPADVARPAEPSPVVPVEPSRALEKVTEEPTGTAAFGSDRNASPDAILIRRTMKVIEPVADKTTSYFYALLFLQYPALRELFPAAMDAQRDRLFQALLTAAKHVDDADTLTAYLANLGRGHRKYGTQPEHYPAVGECLIGALTRYASEIWNEEVEAAWVRAYTAISQIMIDAASENERVAPAWWQAEIVSHERRTADIAVVTVRPDQPYSFLAGQYASLETPWWPRVWRHYSFASAPRADGLLSFHIKTVPAGWVSSAIVNRARPGDVIRLGPPAGSMTVNHGTDDGLLCLGGGTGIAPIKALVEDVAEHGRRRPVEVFYAARSEYDLYDLDTMMRMEQQHSWLSVRPVVAHGPADQHMVAGRLPDIVTRFGPWPAFDAYLSGPAGMIRSSVDALVGIGMPSYRIRHDSLEELVSARD